MIIKRCNNNSLNITICVCVAYVIVYYIFQIYHVDRNVCVYGRAIGEGTNLSLRRFSVTLKNVHLFPSYWRNCQDEKYRTFVCNCCENHPPGNVLYRILTFPRRVFETNWFHRKFRHIFAARREISLPWQSLSCHKIFLFPRLMNTRKQPNITQSKWT